MVEARSQGRAFYLRMAINGIIIEAAISNRASQSGQWNILLFAITIEYFSKENNYIATHPIQAIHDHHNKCGR